jgi:hypothetical protein
LEELISVEDRKRFNIHSRTPIVLGVERGAKGSENEFNREVLVIKNDKQIREFMNENGIKTTSSQAANETRIREWALLKGCRIRWK